MNTEEIMNMKEALSSFGLSRVQTAFCILYALTGDQTFVAELDAVNGCNSPLAQNEMNSQTAPSQEMMRKMFPYVCKHA